MYLKFPDDPAVADAMAHRLAEQMTSIAGALERQPGVFKLAAPTIDSQWRAEVEFDPVPSTFGAVGVGFTPSEAVDTLLVQLRRQGRLP